MRVRKPSAPRPAIDLSQFEEFTTRERWKTLPATVASLAFHAGLIVLALIFVRQTPTATGSGSDPIVVTLGSGSVTTAETSSGKSAPSAVPPAAPTLSNKPSKHPREKHLEIVPKIASEPLAAFPASPSKELAPSAATANSGQAGSNPSSSAQAGGDRPGNSDATVAGAGSGGNGAFGVDQIEHPPAVVSSVTPVYPQLARRRGIEGVVVLKFVVNQVGTVENEIQIIESVPILDDAAIDALRRWRFSPGRDREGNPVRVMLEVPIRFTLR